MYTWLWRTLPGNAWARALQCAVLAAAAVAALFLWVFPRVEAQLPYNDVTVPVETPTGSPSPDATAPPTG